MPWIFVKLLSKYSLEKALKEGRSLCRFFALTDSDTPTCSARLNYRKVVLSWCFATERDARYVTTFSHLFHRRAAELHKT